MSRQYAVIWCVNLNTCFLTPVALSLCVTLKFRFQWLVFLSSVSCKASAATQSPQWTNGSDVQIHRLAFRSHLTILCPPLLYPQHLLPSPRPPSHSARTWCAYKFRQQTGIEQRYRTVRSKTSPKHMITRRVVRRQGTGIRKEYDLFVCIFRCLKRCSNCAACRSRTIWDDCTSKSFKRAFWQLLLWLKKLPWAFQNETYLFYVWRSAYRAENTLHLGYKYQPVNFDVLLTVHLSIILVINQFNAQILFYNNSFCASTCLEHYVLIIRRSKLYCILSHSVIQKDGLKFLRLYFLNYTQ